MNWINATERKPDTTRKVFVRGSRREGEETVAVACWWDFDNRWTNFNIIDNEDTAIGIQVTHWMEITDILTSLDTAEPEGKSEIGVHGKSLVRPTLSKRGWGSPLLAKKFHYFNNDLISLCGKWMYAGELEDTMHDHANNCKACMKKRDVLERGNQE